MNIQLLKSMAAMNDAHAVKTKQAWSCQGAYAMLTPLISVAQPHVGDAELPPASHEDTALLPPTMMTASYGLLLKDLTYVRG